MTMVFKPSSNEMNTWGQWRGRRAKDFKRLLDLGVRVNRKGKDCESRMLENLLSSVTGSDLNSAPRTDWRNAKGRSQRSLKPGPLPRYSSQHLGVSEANSRTSNLSCSLAFSSSICLRYHSLQQQPHSFPVPPYASHCSLYFMGTFYNEIAVPIQWQCKNKQMSAINKFEVYPGK